MFTKSKDPETSVAQPQAVKRTSRTSVPSIISADLTVIGTLISTGDVQVDGRVEGDIRATALVIGEDASIHGDVYADDAIIRGRVEGGIRAKKVQLCSTSHVEGNILHEALSVEAGAFFEGNCRHSDNPLQDADKLNTGMRGAAKQAAPVAVPTASANGSGSSAEPHAAVAASPARPAASFTPLKG
jgi:cytoskeletal protein CcmA (bactofilin family)